MEISKKAIGNSITRQKTRWLSLCSNLTIGDELKNDVFNSLVTLYTESHRAYHNLQHIEALLKLAEKEQINNEDLEAVNFAIWFHDAIYNPARDDNEEQSANLAVAKLKQFKIEDKRIEKIRQIILATKTHDLALLDTDGKLFLDFDLSILGADEIIYNGYTTAIRAEYNFVPETLYRNGRSQILQSFIRRDFIYSTIVCREKFELQARKNIQREIVELSK